MVHTDASDANASVVVINNQIKPMLSFIKLTQTLRGPLHETQHETHAGMSFMPAPVFISGAGLSYCYVYMMSGRYETFISGRHENFMSPFHAGMKMGSKSHENRIFSFPGDMKTKSPSSIVVCFCFL